MGDRCQQRDGDKEAEQVAAHDPGGAVKLLDGDGEIDDDFGQGRHYDGLVERGEKYHAAGRQHRQKSSIVSQLSMLDTSNALHFTVLSNVCRLAAAVYHGVAVGWVTGVAGIGVDGASISICSPKLESVKVRTVLAVSPCAATPFMIIW